MVGGVFVRFWKRCMLFYLGGMLYTGLELLWRRRSHGSMFALGGLCFLLIGRVEKSRLHPAARAVTEAGAVTALELGCGLLVNRRFRVWDYRRLPMNFRGQICLPFSLLWIPVCMVGAAIYRRVDRLLTFRVKTLK